MAGFAWPLRPLAGTIAMSLAMLSGCVAPPGGGWGQRAPYPDCGGWPCPPAPAAGAAMSTPEPPKLNPVQTAEAEARDRLLRLREIVKASGAPDASLDVLPVGPGASPETDAAAPVMRVVFPERAFFDFDGDQPRPQSRRILERIADSLRRDNPGTAVTVIGHTDAIGSAEYNMDLSRRRAQSVVQLLVQAGANPANLSLVAIGKAQPIASNDTEDGRALNRRVEFLVSANLQANLDAVRNRPVNPAYLNPEERVGPRHVAVYPGTSLINGSEPAAIADLMLQAPLPEAATVPAALALPQPREAAAPVPPRTLVPRDPEPRLNTPDPIRKRELEPAS